MKSNVLNFCVDKENKKITVHRSFAAPVSKVWAAFTQKELLDKWWAPKPWQAKTKFMDFSEGGYWLYAMVGPNDETHWSRADFKAITPLKSFSSKDAFCDENGNVNNNMPSSLWTNTFTEADNSTIVWVEIQFDDLADLEKLIEMGFEEGFKSGLQNLDELLAAS